MDTTGGGGGEDIPAIMGVGVNEGGGGTKGRGELEGTVSIEAVGWKREGNTGEGRVPD